MTPDGGWAPRPKLPTVVLTWAAKNRFERRDETREERDGYYWHERTAGSFVRSIPLPDGADTDNAKARFENGVLEVSVPAPEDQSSRGRRIEIR